MQADLFLARPEDLNLLPVDGSVHSYGAVLTSSEADSFFSRLLLDIAWAADCAKVNGKLIQTVRQVAEFAAVQEP
jgi:hypothetical protein